MNDLETLQYLFDVQGYLVLENVLDAEEVAELNHLLDAHLPPAKGNRFGSAPDGSGFLDWGQPFIDLLDHPQIMPILRFRLGDCFRLDRIYGLCLRHGMARGVLHSDYGATSPTSGAQPGQYYPLRDNQILNGFVVATWNLTDAGPDYGGFCCIPGSHKSNFILPQPIADAPEQAPCVIIPSAPAGSVTLFTEALTHGTAAWHGHHQRRALLYKYCVSQMAWTNRRVQAPADLRLASTVSSAEPSSGVRRAQPSRRSLTRRQQILFGEPADPHRFFPSLFEGVDEVTSS